MLDKPLMYISVGCNTVEKQIKTNQLYQKPSGNIDTCLEIYNGYKNDLTASIYTLATQYGTTANMISSICNGKHWSTKGMNSLITKDRMQNSQNKVTSNQAKEIYSSFKNGLCTAKQIAKQYEVCKLVVYNILKGNYFGTKGYENLMINQRHNIDRTTCLNIYQDYQSLKNTIGKYKILMKKYPNISYHTMQRICTNLHWSTKSLNEAL